MHLLKQTMGDTLSRETTLFRARKAQYEAAFLSDLARYAAERFVATGYVSFLWLYNESQQQADRLYRYSRAIMGIEPATVVIIDAVIPVNDLSGTLH